MKKIIICISILAATVIAQIGPVIPAGNTAVLSWAPNDPSEGVLFYTVYQQGATFTNKLASTPNTTVALSTLSLGNGTYSFILTASNVNGESGSSSNVVVKYWANKPLPPGGINVH